MVTGKTRKSISIITLLMRYMLLCILATFAIIALWWGCLAVLIRLGIVLPANAAEQAAQQAQQVLIAQGVFKPQLVPNLCSYALFDEKGMLLESPLTGDALRDAQQYLASGINSASRFHVSAAVQQGVCVLQYRLEAIFANPTLHAALPNFQAIFFVLLLLLLVATLGGITFHYVHIFKQRLQALSAAASQLASGDLAREFPQSGIREYDAVLGAMRELQSALRLSLQQQWNMEHSRIAQTNALAHDLRTPLTIIDGNAQLLGETALTSEQETCLAAIARSTLSAQEYIAKIREIAHADSAIPMQKTSVIGEDFLQCIKQDAAEICKVHGVLLNFTATAPPQLCLAVPEVRRALSNIIENAAAHTPAGSAVCVRVNWQAPTLTFMVEDGGDGFSAQALCHALEPFYTEDLSRAQNGHMGVGLSFAAAIAAKHGGAIQLANIPQGHGMVTFLLNCLGNAECS